MDNINLKIYTPNGIICDTMVSLVTLPGRLSSFTILKNHSPIISSLEQGVIKYVSSNETNKISIDDGFVEAKDNIVTIFTDSHKK